MRAMAQLFLTRVSGAASGALVTALFLKTASLSGFLGWSDALPAIAAGALVGGALVHILGLALEPLRAVAYRRRAA